MRFFAGVAIVILIEFYGFIAIRGFSYSNSKTKKIVTGIYIAATLLLWAALVTNRTWGHDVFSKDARTIISTLFFSFTVAKLVVTLFLFPADIVRSARWLLQRVFSTNSSTPSASRSMFLNKLALMAAAVPFGSLIYGAVNNAYNYRFRKVAVLSPNLPKSFDGFTIVQLSDIHAGSFARTHPIENAIHQINALQADLVVFTGDLVNNIADEMDDYKKIFARLNARYGVMSVTGNHDYGDYIPWNSEEEKKANFAKLIRTHREMGWDILMNEHRVIEKNGEKIAVLGIENWGAKMHFPKYGKLDVAYSNMAAVPFKVLLSHDPSHWDAQVRPKYPDIDLTLSGHTHGFQFGIESKFLKWSPAQWAYKQWAGLYKEGAQYLYVNRGFGFLGYPGRIGILPEITVIELKRA